MGAQSSHNSVDSPSPRSMRVTPAHALTARRANGSTTTTLTTGSNAVSFVTGPHRSTSHEVLLVILALSAENRPPGRSQPATSIVCSAPSDSATGLARITPEEGPERSRVLRASPRGRLLPDGRAANDVVCRDSRPRPLSIPTLSPVASRNMPSAAPPGPPGRHCGRQPRRRRSRHDRNLIRKSNLSAAQTASADWRET